MDNRQYGFFTHAWGADRGVDLRHWAQLPGFSAELKARVAADGGAALDLARLPHIFMRWKEKHFMAGDAAGGDAADAPGAHAHAGLTISGFYYASLNRADGSVHGLYFDPTSRPFQQLRLQPLPADAYSSVGDDSSAAQAAMQTDGTLDVGPQCFASYAFR